MYTKIVAKHLQDCFTQATSHINTVNNAMLETLKFCYVFNGLEFTNCDHECLWASPVILPVHTNHCSTRYDSAKLEDFYNTVAKENVELCYYNCHHLDQTEL